MSDVSLRSYCITCQRSLTFSMLRDKIKLYPTEENFLCSHGHEIAGCDPTIAFKIDLLSDFEEKSPYTFTYLPCCRYFH